MGKIIQRLFQLNLPAGKSAFLWGPRKVGKSFWIRKHLPKATLIDLLKSEEFADYATRPALLRQRFQNHSKKELIVIDEIQKVPALLDEVHWLIENKGLAFLLTGSSARKLKRSGANLLGGRAWRRHMTPLCFPEIEKIDLEKIMVTGLLPSHYLSKHPQEELRAYLADYLKEEIAAEAAVQNLPAFHDFLRIAAITSGELLNYSNVARETGVSAKIVRHYFQILEDTFLGFRVQPWRKSRDRRLIETEKFYFFDLGVTHYLARRAPKISTPEFGKAFEQFILLELMAYRAYRQAELEIRFWRTSTNQAVDFILNEKEVALEIKASSRIHETDLKSLKLFQEDQGKVKKSLVISLARKPQQLGKISVLPWQDFLKELWSGNIL